MKLKLLLITRDYSNYLERSLYYFSLELAKLAEVAVVHEGGNIHRILESLPFSPDFILVDDMRNLPLYMMTGLSELTIPWGITMHDLHYQVQERKRFAAETKVPYLISMYKSAFKQRYPELIHRMIWLPHFAEPSLFRDYGQHKAIDMLMMGCTDRKYYPLRHRMLQNLQGIEGFTYHLHPGYRTFQPDSADMIGATYAKEINRAKLFLSCDSLFQYPLRKYFEVLASRTLLLAPINEDLIELGFVDGKHFVTVNADDYEEKIRFCLDPRNEAAVGQIVQAGYEFVRENHTTAVRAHEFIRMVSGIVGMN